MRSDKIINSGAVLGLYIYALIGSSDRIVIIFATVITILWLLDLIAFTNKDMVQTPAPMQEWVVYDDNPSGGESETVWAHTELEAVGTVAAQVYDMYAKPKQPQ